MCAEAKAFASGPGMERNERTVSIMPLEAALPDQKTSHWDSSFIKYLTTSQGKKKSLNTCVFEEASRSKSWFLMFKFKQLQQIAGMESGVYQIPSNYEGS